MEALVSLLMILGLLVGSAGLVEGWCWWQARRRVRALLHADDWASEGNVR